MTTIICAGLVAPDEDLSQYERLSASAACPEGECASGDCTTLKVCSTAPPEVDPPETTDGSNTDGAMSDVSDTDQAIDPAGTDGAATDPGDTTDQAGQDTDGAGTTDVADTDAADTDAPSPQQGTAGSPGSTPVTRPVDDADKGSSSCGCRVLGAHAKASWWTPLLALAALALRRRRYSAGARRTGWRSATALRAALLGLVVLGGATLSPAARADVPPPSPDGDCDCRVASSAPTTAWWVPLVLAAGFSLRRRQSRRAVPHPAPRHQPRVSGVIVSVALLTSLCLGAASARADVVPPPSEAVPPADSNQEPPAVEAAKPEQAAGCSAKLGKGSGYLLMSALALGAAALLRRSAKRTAARPTAA